MNPERFQQVQSLHGRALELEPHARDAFLDAACAGDDALRKEVASLLDASARMGGFLSAPAPELVVDFAPEALERGARIGRYEIVEQIATGGGGAVYEAMQESPRRKVALKVMHAHLATADAARRFEDEAEILAQLTHPGIATIYEAGVHEDAGAIVPWFALEYVEGARSLVEHAQTLGRRERLEGFVRVCDAVHHGHVKGVIHRDLKPGNVLVDPTGRPKVIDFGIASLAGGADAEDREIVGTLPYMSPEQADPERGSVDARSDVYALGVLLYELLTGELPLDVTDLPLHEALRTIRDVAPTRVTAKDPSLRGDLDAIVTRALAKDAEDRYASASALADDVRRYLEHRPIEARPATLPYQLGKFARRSRVAFAAITLLVLVSVGAAVANRLLAVESETARRNAEVEAYVASIAAAEAALRVNDVHAAAQWLAKAPRALRGWEWHHLSGRVDLSERTITWDDRAIRTGSLSRDGRLAAVSSIAPPDRHELGVLDVQTGRELWSEPTKLRADAFAFSPDGASLAVGHEAGRVVLRNPRTGAVQLTLEGHEQDINALVFDPTGKQLASASRDKTIRLWSIPDGALVRTLEGHADRVISLDWHAHLASGGREGSVRIWDEGPQVVAAHDESVEGLAVNPAGTRLVTVSRDFTARLFELPGGRRLATGTEHTGNVRDVAFSPDGAIFATASWDHTVRLYDGSDGSPGPCLRGHKAQVQRVEFVRDTRLLASFSTDGTLKLWDTEQADRVKTLVADADAVDRLHFDGDVLFSRSRDAAVRAWDAARGMDLGALAPKDPNRDVVSAAFTDTAWTNVAWPPALTLERGRVREACLNLNVGLTYDEHTRRSAIPIDGGEVRIWDHAAEKQLTTLVVGTERPTAVALARGHLLAAGDASGAIATWNADEGIRLASTGSGDAAISTLRFDPPARLLAAGQVDGLVRVLEADGLAVRHTLRGHSRRVWSCAFSPDGTRLATASADRTVRLWDLATGRQVLVLHGHAYPVRAVAWSSDGRLLASGDGSSEVPGVIKVWSAGKR